MRRAVLRIYRGTRWIPLQTADVRITVVGRGSNAEAMVLVVVGVRPGRMASARACFMAPQWPRKCLFGEDRFERVGADHPAQRSREAAEASSMYHSARPCRSKWSDRRQWVQTPRSSGLAPARTPWSEGVPHSPEYARCRPKLDFRFPVTFPEVAVANGSGLTVEISRTSTTDPPNRTFRRTLERRGSESRDENFTRAFEQGLWPSPGRRGAANEHAEPRRRGCLRAALRGAVVVSSVFFVRPSAGKGKG